MGPLTLYVLAILAMTFIVNCHHQLLRPNQLAVYLMNQLAKDEDYMCSSPEDPNCSIFVPDAEINQYDNSEIVAEQTGRTVDKKAHMRPFGCDCRSHIALVDLGANFIPRWFKNVTCQNDKCTYNMHCESTLYPVTVLTRRIHSNEIEEYQLPEELRERWKFNTVNMVADCMCTY